jgi:putative membrane protein
MDGTALPNPSPAELAASEDWRRLSPLTLLLAVVRLGPASLRMIPALAAIGIAGSWHYVVPALGLFLLASLAMAWLAWVRFRWRIGEDAIVIESGILERQHRTIPFDRIQDVGIEQGLVARVLDIAKVGFETGASGDADKSDGGLDSISVEDAAALRAVIRGWRAGGGDAAASTVPISLDVAAADPALFTLTAQRLLLAGLFNFSLAALAVVGAAGQWLDDLLPIDIFSVRFWMNLAEDSGVGSWVDAHRWVAGLGAVAALLFVGFATGIVRTALTNWNFLLTLGPRAFRRVRGLTTRTDVAIPLARIQAAVVATGIIRRRWGWHELRVQSLASDSKEEKDHQLVPFAQLEDVDAVLAPTGLARPTDGLDWHVPPLVAQALPGLIMAAIAGLVGVVGLGLGQWQGAAALAVAGLLIVAAVLAAGKHRWADDGRTLYIWRGFWRPRLTILPFANVQSADVRDGPVLRRLGCLAVTLGVPGDSSLASHDIDAVPAELALALRRRILAQRTARR